MIEEFKVVVTPFMQNARIVYDARSKEAVVIDPGGEAEKINEALKKLSLSCSEIWLTHSHLDHCGGVSDLIEMTKARLVANPIEKSMREHVTDIAAMYGIPGGYFKNCPEPDISVQGGEKLKMGDYEFEVIFTPGHSPGHVSFLNRKNGIIISGDVLFAGGIGRTDLPGGDYQILMRTIYNQFLTLPDATKVWCGHGDDTTIGSERLENPFLQR